MVFNNHYLLNHHIINNIHHSHSHNLPSQPPQPKPAAVPPKPQPTAKLTPTPKPDGKKLAGAHPLVPTDDKKKKQTRDS